MKPAHQVFFAAGLLVLGASTWLVLSPPKPQADWLRVEAPARAVPGETITVRVTLTEPYPGLHLETDLHGWTRRKQPLRAISHTDSHRLDGSLRVLDFQLRVPVLPDLATVRAIVYLSPTGRWSDQVHAITSDPIPVEAAPHPASPRELQPLPVYEQRSDPEIPRIESAALRHLIIALWLVVALGLGWRWRRARRSQPASPGQPARLSPASLAGACAAAALAEFFGAEQYLGNTARQLALQSGFYADRHLPQQLAVLCLVVGVAALAVTVMIRARHRRIVLGLLVYAVVAVAAALSLHETDALLYATFLGQPVEQLAKLLAVGLALWGLSTRVTAGPAPSSA
jgi:hypothetical protein